MLKYIALSLQTLRLNGGQVQANDLPNSKASHGESCPSKLMMLLLITLQNAAKQQCRVLEDHCLVLSSVYTVQVRKLHEMACTVLEWLQGEAIGISYDDDTAGRMPSLLKAADHRMAPDAVTSATRATH